MSAEMEEVQSETDSQFSDRCQSLSTDSINSDQDSTEATPQTPSFTTSHSDGGSSDSDIHNFFVDFDEIIGKDMVVCSYMKPTTLRLYKPSAVDTLESLSKFVKHSMDYNHHYHRLAFLFPNEPYPQDIGDVVTLKLGTALVILPKALSKVTIHIHKLNSLFEVDTDLCSHVLSVKQMIEAEHGFPVLQQELVFQGQCLENQDRLYQWEIRSQSVLDLHLHFQYNLVVTVKTFWKTVYDLFVDPCMLVSDVLETVLKRCVSPHVYKDCSILSDVIIPRHMLVLTSRGRTLNADSTLGLYHIQDGDILQITTIGRQHRVNVHPIEVNLNDGRAARIVVSQFDTWAILAFHMHGITAVPIDKIRLFHNNNLVNYATPIGTSATENIEVRHPEEASRHTCRKKGRRKGSTEVDPLISVMVYLGSSVVENIKCPMTMSIHEIIQRVEEMGVPNAHHYHLTTRHGTLPDTLQVKHIVKSGQTSLQVTLKLERFPVNVKLPNDKLVTVTVHVNQTIQNVLRVIQKKCQVSLLHHKLLLTGCELQEAADTTVYDSDLCIGTTLYLVSRQRALSFHVHSDTGVTKLHLPPKQTAPQIKQTIWKARNLSSTCLTSLETFLKWHLSLVPSVKLHEHSIMLPNVTGTSPSSHGNVQKPNSTTINHRGRYYPEISPTTGSVQIPNKTVQFTDVLPRPKGAKRHRKNAHVDTFIPLFSSERDHSSATTIPYDWVPSTNGTSLPDISVPSGVICVHAPVATGLKRTKRDTKVDVGDEVQKLILSDKPQDEVEPWSYIT